MDFLIGCCEGFSILKKWTLYKILKLLRLFVAREILLKFTLKEDVREKRIPSIRSNYQLQLQGEEKRRNISF